MMAFDRRTGDLRWKTPRRSGAVCYSVPYIYRGSDGKDQLICTNTGDGFYSLDPHTGEENWRIADAFTMRTVSSPTMVDGVIFGSTGKGGFASNYVVAIRPEPKPQIAYEVDRSAPYVPCIVGRGNLAFLWFDEGIASCIEAATGEVHWQKRIGGGFSASPVRVRDRIFGVNNEGEVIVLAAEKTFQVLAKNPLGEPSRATPAVAGGRMYFRTYSHLISIGGKEAAE
jgi:outer membrane protein assembly factor BamB